MAYTTIDDPSQYFQIALWTGSSGTDTITFDGNSDLQLDFLWTKCRSNGHSHALMDTSRITSGDYLPLFADTDDQEQTFYDSELQSITSDGFTVGTQPHAGGDGKTYVGWAWKANGGTTSSNNDGSYTSTVQANTTAGFSIVKYGDASSFSASSPATVGHGLGSAPKWILIKNLDGSRSWGVHHVSNGAGKIIYLDLTNAVANSTGFDNGTLPSSSVFTVNTLNVANGNNLEYIAYCWAEVQGYSKFGSYTGNGNDNGPFVYTGFKPAWVLYKRTNDAGNWRILDNKRNTFNVIDNEIYADLDNSEAQDNQMDFLSNGFKLRNGSSVGQNGNGSTYIYMAFAEHPFVSSKGVPVTAK